MFRRDGFYGEPSHKFVVVVKQLDLLFLYRVTKYQKLFVLKLERLDLLLELLDVGCLRLPKLCLESVDFLLVGCLPPGVVC